VIRLLNYLLLGLVLLFSSCTSHKPEPSSQPSIAPELLVVTTTDFHSFLEKAEGLASVVRNLKQQHGDRMLYLDAGDQFQGSLEGNLSKGEAMVRLMNLIPLDAGAIGNHELDYGPAVPDRVLVMPEEDGLGNLRARVAQASFEWISANFIADPAQSCDPQKQMLCNALGQKTMFRPRAILNRGGYKIGIIGATTATTAKITRPAFVKGSKFEDIAPVTIAEAAFLRNQQKCDLVFLLAHEGPRKNPAGGYRHDIGILPVFSKLPPGTLDAAVLGHSHIRVQEVIAGIPVIQAGLYGQVVGLMRIRGKKPIKVSFEPFIEVPEKAAQPDITQELFPFRKAAAELKRRPIGQATAIFKRSSTSENPLGNMVADAILVGAKAMGDAQFSVLNAGGIRNDLPGGNLSYGDLFRVMPFENLVAIVQLKGSELRKMLEIAFSGALGDAPIAGLKVVRLEVLPDIQGPWDRDLDGNGVRETWERNLIVSIHDHEGNPIQDENWYTVATSDYLTNGGDYQSEVFDKIPPDRIHVHSELPWRDVVVKYINTHSPIDPSQFYTPETRRIILSSPQ
jgi:5'-nucleotidase